MRRNILFIIGLTGTVLLAGCSKTSPEDDNSLVIEEQPAEAASEATSIEAEQTESNTADSGASDASVASSTAAGEEFGAIYGLNFVVPEGFENVSVHPEGYEKGNAAGGYTHNFKNEDLGMEIEVAEYLWANVPVEAENKEEFLKKQYDSTVGADFESEIGDDYFYNSTLDEAGTRTYFREIVTDDAAFDITITYTDGDSESEAVKDEFINSCTIDKE
ncbi:MAG: hypothetical protein J5802_13445 [Butyrivibrio sp.]|nr:hypothetical protein [Butyrivibrio sp.]